MEINQFYESIGTEYKILLARFCNNEQVLNRFVRSFPDDPTYNRAVTAVKRTELYRSGKSGTRAKGGICKSGIRQSADCMCTSCTLRQVGKM